jgi:cytochrome c-type biogenesis protein CcsB
MDNLIYTAYALLIIAFVYSLTALKAPNQSNKLMPTWLTMAAFGFLTLALTIRGLISGRVPFANLYEFTLLFVWGILLFYLIIRRQINAPLFTVLVLLVNIILISYSFVLPSDVSMLMPALQSHWLEIHVITAIIAYGAFGVAFCLGVLYLLKENYPTNRLYATLPPLNKLDNTLYWSVAVGFPFMALVLITGAVWAEEAWGTWWSWDPKETWALITWLVYAAYLHARLTLGWQGKRSAVMAVVGFIVVLFTFYGVSYLLPGNHSYV